MVKNSLLGPFLYHRTLNDDSLNKIECVTGDAAILGKMRLKDQKSRSQLDQICSKMAEAHTLTAPCQVSS